ncbi:MAG: hypothetical protein ACFE8J_16255 [Candidatus Heimdallarchaeota archaeon]
MATTFGKIIITIAAVLSLIVLFILSAVFMLIGYLVISIILWILMVIIAIAVIIWIIHLWTVSDPGGCAPVILILVCVAFTILTMNYIIL